MLKAIIYWFAVGAAAGAISVWGSGILYSSMVRNMLSNCPSGYACRLPINAMVVFGILYAITLAFFGVIYYLLFERKKISAA